MKYSAPHLLLERQLRKLGLSETKAPPTIELWQQFLQRVVKGYEEAYDAKTSAENVLDVSLKEMDKLQAELSQSNQRKIKDLNERLSLVLAASEMGTFDWDMVSNEVKYDERWCEILGYRIDEIKHHFQTFRDHLHPDDLNRVLAAVQNCVSRAQQKYEIKFRMKHKEGHWVDIHAIGKIVAESSTGKPMRFVGTHLDVTQEQNLIREVENQRVKFIQTSKMAALGEMSAGIAHEINNPLAIISGTLHLIPRCANNEESLKARALTIQKACDRIIKIVKGLRKFSRSGEKINVGRASLKEIILESIGLTESKAKQNFVEVTVECDRSLELFCDEIAIEQVLINLLNNAIDAIRSLEHRWIKIKGFEDKTHYVLQIIDSGSGIPLDVQEKLFQPFFTTKAVGEGTGLGLSITKGILDEHKASITVINSSPHTCFEIRFLKGEPKQQEAA